MMTSPRARHVERYPTSNLIFIYFTVSVLEGFLWLVVERMCVKVCAYMSFERLIYLEL